jgi:hypothetical protein
MTSGLNLTRVRTRNQNGDASCFRFSEDALILAIDIVVSDELVKTGVRYHANFQILDRSTNSVIRDYWLRDMKFDSGSEFWVYLGKAGSPPDEYTTPQKWGLRPGLYGFRGVVELGASATFCESQETLFRIYRYDPIE